jgi:hypothetical protein
MSTGSAGTANTAGSGSAIAGQGGGSSGAAAANITQLAAAIHDAVTWTEQSRAAVLGLIVEDLGTTNPKVGVFVCDRGTDPHRLATHIQDAGCCMYASIACMPYPCIPYV